MRHDTKEKDYVWRKKRRRSADKGSKKDRRRKVVDGIIIEDYDRRQVDDPEYKGSKRRSNVDRRKIIDRRK